MTRCASILTFLFGCAESNDPPDGYLRLRTPTVAVQPGASDLWAQWVTAPMDRDMDVADLTGTQSAGGHHALLYSMTDIEPVGFTRPWKDSDLLSARFIGG